MEPLTILHLQLLTLREPATSNVYSIEAGQCKFDLYLPGCNFWDRIDSLDTVVSEVDVCNDGAQCIANLLPVGISVLA